MSRAVLEAVKSGGDEEGFPAVETPGEGGRAQLGPSGALGRGEGGGWGIFAGRKHNEIQVVLKKKHFLK